MAFRVNSVECCAAVTLPLHGGANPRMYGVLTANTPGCVAFSLPVQRWNLPILEIPASSGPSLRASAERGQKRGAVSSPSGVQSQLDGTVLRRTPRYRARPKGSQVILGERYHAKHLAISDDKQGGISCRQHVPDGPTLDAPDCDADQIPRTTRPAAER